MEEQHLTPFEGSDIRKIWHDEQWYFSIYDVLQILANTTNPKRYWSDLKKRDTELDKQGGTQISYPLKMQTAGGKQSVICANTEGVFRIVMSVPSAKAEPLRLWLAQVGKERMEETENPELSFERMTEIYKAKGRSEEWIKERFQSIETRKRLTDEWKNRGVKVGQEYSILTATIAKGTFGLTPSEHSKVKGLENQNLRDHMTPLELILTSLSEEVTRTITVDNDAQGFHENQDAAVRGGQIGRKALLNVEEGTGKKVVSTTNYLNPPTDADKEALPQKAADEPTE